MRLIYIVFALCAAACDHNPTTAAGIVSTECTPMPAECPAQLSCEVTTTVEDGEEVRVCGGASCCQSFCELNGCGKCCGPAGGATAAAPAPAR